jgi:hypothetical protein
MRAEPERTLDEWFGERRLGLHGFLDALVAAGEWDMSQTILGRHRYHAKDQTRRDRDKELDLNASGVWTPMDAAVATLGSMAHLVGKFRRLGYVVSPPDIPEAVLSAAGAQEWMLRAGVDFLRRMRTQYRYNDAVLGSGSPLH